MQILTSKGEGAGPVELKESEPETPAAEEEEDLPF
jgi:hypothetical protein